MARRKKTRRLRGTDLELDVRGLSSQLHDKKHLGTLVLKLSRLTFAKLEVAYLEDCLRKEKQGHDTSGATLAGFASEILDGAFEPAQ